MAVRDPSNPSDPSLLDILRSLAWAPPNLPLFRSAPPAPDGSAPAAAPASGAAQPAPAQDPSWRDIWTSLAWAPPNLPLFRSAPSAADGSAPAAPPTSGAMQPAAALRLGGPGPSPVVTPVADLHFNDHVQPVAPPVPFMDRNRFFEQPQDQPLYSYTQPGGTVRPSFNERWSGRFDVPNPSASPATNQPAASIPLPPPRPPEAGPRPQAAGLTPMYPPPKAPAKPQKYLDPRTAPPPLMAPSDGWRRPDLEDKWSSPWWLSSLPTPPTRPDFDPPDMSFLRSKLAEQNLDADDFVDRVIYAESGGNTYAYAGPRGGAGPAQFVRDTWRAELAQRHPDLITQNPWLDPAMRQLSHPSAGAIRAQTDVLAGSRDPRAGQQTGMRTDYALSRQVAAEYLNELARTLDDHHLPVTPGNVYLMYFAGPTAGLKILNTAATDPNAQWRRLRRGLCEKTRISSGGLPQSASCRRIVPIRLRERGPICFHSTGRRLSGADARR